MFKNILFVCTGNICRSPMAEGLFKSKLANENAEGFVVHSAGIKALVGEEAVFEAQAVMKEQGMDVAAHRAKQLIEKDIHAADLILVMENWQKTFIDKHFPYARGRVFLLGQWSGGFEIPDPYRASLSVFRDTFRLVEEGCEEWFEKIFY